MELLDNLPEEEESQITLTGEDGEEITFDYLDCLTYQDTEYLVLMPTETDETQIVILEIQPVDDENETYLPVEDEAILDAVYGLFKEKYKDILTFEDYAAPPEKSARRGFPTGGQLLFYSGKNHFTERSPRKRPGPGYGSGTAILGS